MKVRQTASLLVLLGLLLTSHSVPARPSVGGNQLGAKTLKFDKEKFAATINQNRLGAAGPLDGYAAVIIKDGVVVGEVAGGLAIRGGGGLKQEAMTTSIPTDIGSTFKLLSFITLLSEFEKRAAANRAATMESQLNGTIRPFMPKAWGSWIDTPPDDTAAESQATFRIGKTTFAQLFSHKSGFRSISSPTKVPFDYIDKGIQQSDVGVRSYSNFNATVLTYLWPRLMDPATADKFDKLLAAGKVSNRDHKTLGKLYGDFFESWMQQKVFDVIKPGFRPSCDPAVDFPKRNPPVVFARFYDAPLGGDNPRFWSEKANNFGCHAQGGYYLSMRQLAAFMANYQATNTLVSEKTRKLMYDDSTAATRDARLGWSRILESEFATKNFKVNRVPWHGGDGYGHTAIVQLPGGFIAVGTVTGDGSGGSVASALEAGWADALRANFE
jgi:hypothetical protein